MRPLTFAFILSSVMAIANLEPIEDLKHILVYPVEPATKKTKRETVPVKSKSDYNKFVEEKLIQHTQALEHLVKLTQNNEDTIKQLVTSLSQNVEKPKLPEKLEVQNTRRSNVLVKPEHPVVRYGRNVPKYAILFKDLILTALLSNEEPIAVAERDSDNSESRRSFGGRPLVVPTSKNDNQQSPWCSVAILCRRSMDPACGYDDNFGYGKFDDICHMLQVNCYWKYNFALVPSCRPIL